MFNKEGITIAFLGDSVTQGCFELYKTQSGGFETVYDKNSTYHSYLDRILTLLYPNVPVNVINAGISGGSALHGLKRLERDVLRHQPDLTVVCFGLNDSGMGLEGLDKYVSVSVTDAVLRDIAENTQKTQNSGMLETYLEAAVALCERQNVKVCDCYKKWKRLAENGVDTTNLLSNKINHPTREMNWLFAISLLDVMMEEV